VEDNESSSEEEKQMPQNEIERIEKEIREVIVNAVSNKNH